MTVAGDRCEQLKAQSRYCFGVIAVAGAVGMWKSAVWCWISKQRGKVRLGLGVFSTLRHFHSAPQAFWKIGRGLCWPSVALET
jgi:hypothetical protein